MIFSRSAYLSGNPMSWTPHDIPTRITHPSARFHYDVIGPKKFQNKHRKYLFFKFAELGLTLATSGVISVFILRSGLPDLVIILLWITNIVFWGNIGARIGLRADSRKPKHDFDPIEYFFKEGSLGTNDLDLWPDTISKPYDQRFLSVRTVPSHDRFIRCDVVAIECLWGEPPVLSVVLEH